MGEGGKGGGMRDGRGQEKGCSVGVRIIAPCSTNQNAALCSNTEASCLRFVAMFAVGKKDVGSVHVRVVKQIFILRVCFPALQVFRWRWRAAS